MSEWRSAWVIAPYPPELLPNTPRRPMPPHSKRASIAGSMSCSRKSSQAPMAAELMYWLPPSRVKQSGKATTTGGIRCSPISRSSRSGRFSRKPTQLVCARPLPVKPTRSTSSGKPRPSCPAGTYTSTTRAAGSPSMLPARALPSTVTRLTEPVGPKNLRICPAPAFPQHQSGKIRLHAALAKLVPSASAPGSIRPHPPFPRARSKDVDARIKSAQDGFMLSGLAVVE